MIDFEINQEEGIVVIRPGDPLEESDFTRLAEEVDAYIREKGSIRGLMIHTRSFPGWENFSAFTHHLQFVKDHHKFIKRVAMVTDSKFMAIAPSLANHFVAAEVKHFDYEDLAAAKIWMLEE